jgi:hypothetical protein
VISARFSGLILLARAAPPFRPSATAAGSFPLFLWRRWPILDLPGGNVADQLGKLEGIAGAFAVISHWALAQDE